MMDNLSKVTTQEPPAPYRGSPGSLAIIILSVIIPGLVILTCLIASVFLCWHRDRIPIFRSKAQRYASPAAKTRTPQGGAGGAYPTQTTVIQKSASTAEEGPPSVTIEEGPMMQDTDVAKPKVADEEIGMVVAVDVQDSSKYED